MANFENIIPFILHFETGLPKKYISLSLERMFEEAKKRGYSNDSNDSGGPTMCGVILSTYSFYKGKSQTISQLKAITFTEWKQILKKLFWDRWKADLIENEMLAIALVDFVWASGINGITIPQKILGVDTDGKAGPKTLNAVNSSDPKGLFENVQKARIQYHIDIARPGTKNHGFLYGWNRRVRAITFEGFNFDVK